MFCLVPDENVKDEIEINHTHYVFLEAEESGTYTSDFTGLKPSRKYTLLVRQPWTVRHSIEVRMPEATRVDKAETENPVEIWYLPDGRRTSFPEQPGVYLRKRGGQVEKIYWKQP